MEENILFEGQTNTDAPKRPQFLTVLCILSMCWTGLILLCLLICLCFSGVLFNALQDIVNGTIAAPTVTDEQMKALNVLLDLGKGKFVAIISGVMIIYMTSLLGIIKMWKLHKWGFYIYVFINGASCIYDLITGSFFMGFVSIIFIGMYSVNFKHLK